MGSIGVFGRPKGMTDKAFLAEEYPGYDVLAAKRVGGVMYAAFREGGTFDEGPMRGKVFAFVSPCSSRNGEFIYKMQDETMGPYDTRCPDAILDLLTEPSNEYAAEWRAKCRASNEADREAKARAKLVTPGTVIRTAEPLEFTSGATYDTFQFIERSTFWAGNGDGARLVTVSLTNWKTRDYEIVS